MGVGPGEQAQSERPQFWELSFWMNAWDIHSSLNFEGRIKVGNCKRGAPHVRFRPTIRISSSVHNNYLRSAAHAGSQGSGVVDDVDTAIRRLSASAVV
jgi:hypothetical protein